MYQILIADDNELARQALKKSIRWEKLGCVYAGEAVDGSDALEKIGKLSPDIVLMDIEMPEMSGLDVIQRLRCGAENTVFILITAYDDFQYMRAGMQNGVFDYLLKPVGDEELHTVLKKAVAMLDQKRKAQDRAKQFQEQYQQYESVIRANAEELIEKYFQDALNGQGNAVKRFEEILRESSRIHDYFLMLVNPDKAVPQEKIDEFIARQKSICGECANQFRVDTKGVWRKEGYVVLVSFRQSMFRKEYNLQSMRIAEEIRQKNERHGYPVYITMSRMSAQLTEINQLFEQTQFCKNGRFFLENKSIIHYESMRSTSVTDEYRKTKKLEKLYEACRENPEMVTEYMEDFLEQFSADEMYEIQYIKNIMLQAVLMMVQILRENNRQQDEFKDSVEYMQELSALDSLQSAFAWMRKFAEQIGQSAAQRQSVSPQTKAILDFLHQNYREALTLQDTADYMGLSGTHISRLLKKETGETFVTALNKIRIKEAVRLLKSGKYKVYEIAELVGYSNYAYFYQIFKKNTGVSPKDYV